MAGGPTPAEQIDLSTLIASMNALIQTLGQNGKTLITALTAGVAVLSDPPNYTVADLPTTAANGAFAWASNGRKSGEGSGAGTGVPVFWNSSTSSWYSYLSGAPVTS